MLLPGLEEARWWIGGSRAWEQLRGRGFGGGAVVVGVECAREQ